MSEPTSWDTVEAACPHCRRRLDAATGFDEHAPRPGDLSICLYCSAVLQFTPTGFVLFPEHEIKALPASTRAVLAKARRGTAFVRALMGRPRLNRE